jgi:hypothetical protein
LDERGILVSQPNSSKPIIGVHLLTEFVFCPRAGLCTQETVSEEEPEAPANLNWLPDLDEEEIRLAIQDRSQRALFFAICALVAMLIAIGIQRLELRFWPWVALVGVTTSLVACFHSMWEAMILTYRLSIARRAKPDEPNLGGDPEQEVEWWSLRKAGFDPVKPQANYRDDSLVIVGKPWRVLRRGSYRIPVFRREDNGPVRLQHRVRIAAYCHLLRVCEGMESPYGILLDRKTRMGLAILMTPESALEIVQLELVRARAVITHMKQGEKPPRPNPSLCRGCPHGKPIRVPLDGDQPFTADGRRLPIVARRSRDGRQFHCHCGDRFEEVPPHDSAVTLGLVTA